MSLPKTAILAREIVHRRVKILRRYPLNTVVGLLSGIVFFLLLLVGGRAVGGQRFESQIRAFIVGYYLYSMSIPAFRSLAGTFSNASRTGTLEQLYVTPFGFSYLSFLAITITLTETLLWGLITLFVMVLVTGAPVLFDPLTIVVLSLLTIAPVAGIGFVFGGLAVVYKRVSATFSLLQYGFIFFVFLPAAQNPQLRLLPITDGKYLLLKAMTEGYHIWELSPVALGLLTLKAVLFVGGGIFLFNRIIDVGRKRGVLGHY
jgi:ABC-2 type transport system permease protein